jgi:ABC-type nitrate/sulfonate/bicarbonate transport system ATPase subunit
MIALKAISFAHGSKPVLRDVSLTLRPGEITCLLGASGCGKTTLLQLCAGLLIPSHGAIDADFPRPGSAIGYMQQNDGLLPWCSAWQNVLLGLQLIGMQADRAMAVEALRQVGLADKADHLPSQLSGGQQQRVALARQLVMKPRLLLLDEPLGSLDIVLRQELAQLIKELVKANNIAALVVTHNPDEAIFLADHLCLLKGSPATITHRWTMAKDLSPETAFHTVATALSRETVDA